jgi:hypothetical protein
VTTLAPARASPREFTAGHVAFLSALGRVRRDVMGFATSPCCAFLQVMLEEVEPCLRSIERAALAAALSDCKALLADWMGPFVVRHGDFAPWNIRAWGDRLFVFGWEHARAGANPLADAFNFRVMPRALKRREPDVEFLGTTLRQVQRTADLIYPEFRWRARAVSGLGLAYLLEVLLQCTVATRTLARGHPVVARYLRLVEKRSYWLAT